MRDRGQGKGRAQAAGSARRMHAGLLGLSALLQAAEQSARECGSPRLCSPLQPPTPPRRRSRTGGLCLNGHCPGLRPALRAGDARW